MIYLKTELSHHGVKGMKWGVRKQRPTARKIKNDPYLSAGYKSNGSRQYKASKKVKSTEAQAKERAHAYMNKYFGEKWIKNPSNKDLFDLVLSEMYEEIESKGRYKSPYL